jgi:histidinol dehydrogenase
MTRDEAFGEAVIEAVERQLSTLGRAETARSELGDFGAVIVVPDWETGLAARQPHCRRTSGNRHR